MDKCNDYWCENYGKHNANCEHCEKEESTEDKPDLQVILKRRAVEQMELSKVSNKTQVPGR